MILLKHVILPGEKINQDIIVFLIKKHSILQVAKMFNSRIKFLPTRRGERYASALTSMNLSNKVYKKFGKISLKSYIQNFINSQK